MPRFIVAALMFFMLLTSWAASADCGNARWWRPDNTDLRIQRLWILARVDIHECFGYSPRTRCKDLLSQGESLVDYLLAQSEHARVSRSRTHQGDSLILLRHALSYADSIRSPTALRYFDDHQHRIALAPPLIRQKYWERRTNELLGKFGVLQ